MRLLLAILAAGVPATLVLTILFRLRQHRVDLRSGDSDFDGASPVWQVNVMSPTNYSPAGRRLLRWYLVALLGQLAGLALAVYLVLSKG